MSPTLRWTLAWGALRLARLPSLPALAVDAETEAGFSAAADELLAGGTTSTPEPRLDFLRWLAEHRPVVFHGSPRDDLRELSTERRSHDTTAWGNQQAVYASTDPVWAIYFACLRRDQGWTGTKNGSMGRAGGPLYPRRYFSCTTAARPLPTGSDPARCTSCRLPDSLPTNRSPARSTLRTSSPASRSARSPGSTSRPRTSPSGTRCATTATASRTGSRSSAGASLEQRAGLRPRGCRTEGYS